MTSELEEFLTRAHRAAQAPRRQDLPQSDDKVASTDAERPETDVPLPFLDVP